MTSLDNSHRKYSISSIGNSEADRVEFMLNNMHLNKAYLHASRKLINELDKKKLLEEYKNKFLHYRNGWRNIPAEAIKKKLYSEKFKNKKIEPLCIDLEVASVCDLACPHCFRQYIATPDKLMSTDLAFRLIDQLAEQKVPSVKFNWRGEPLMNRNLPKIIDYAKQNGVLETIINTNATLLEGKYAEELMSSGLDLLIYSFDGGSKKTYDKLRVGRFKENKFENIIKNIENFHKLKKKNGSVFPRTKIQMVLTKETYEEQEEYFSLFKGIVDDVSVKQYTERGGDIKETDVGQNNIDKNKIYMKNFDGDLFVSQGRLPCEQPFQRMLITYDGRVSMCCYDWGSMHPVGYVDNLAIATGDKEFEKVKKDADQNKKGFELMNLKIPEKFNEPEKKISTLDEIWHGKEINKVREQHLKNKLEEVTICKKCPFKDTYDWKKVN
jgi:MoaA/NifB/PqqE/SkfB family radical SAM enzyme